MQNKLQELTEKLYNEGLTKGKQEADTIISQARKESDEIVAAAEAKAQQIISDAEKKAAELQSKVSGDLRMASNQSITATKQYVESMIVAKSVDGNIAKTLSDASFVKELLTLVVKSFNASNPESVPLEVILPTAMKSDLEKALAGEFAKDLSKGLEINYVKGVANGFKIAPKGSGYIISFTGDDFSKMIAAYLRPATRKILFGE